MPRLKDVHLNQKGDLEVGPNGDIACSYDDDVTVDGVLFRLKTQTGDYGLEPACGAGLEEFIGQSNTPELGENVRRRIFSALTHDSFIAPADLTVDVAPLSPTELIAVITTKGLRGSFTVVAALDLLTGRLKLQTP